MKYRQYFAALAVLLATACAKEEITEETKPSLPEDAVLFSGSVERMAGTRTSYEDTEESIIVSWAEGDRIGVFGELDGTVYASNYGYRNSTEGAIGTALKARPPLFLPLMQTRSSERQRVHIHSMPVIHIQQEMILMSSPCR